MYSNFPSACILQTAGLPPSPPLLIPSISARPHSKPALSQLWLWIPRQRKKGGRPRNHSRLDTGTQDSGLPRRLRSVSGSCAYGSYFRATLMNSAPAQQSQCVGAEEDCWLSEKTFQAFLCLSDAARRSAFRGTRLRGEGDGNIGLRRCGGTD